MAALLLLSAACQYLPFVGDDAPPPTPPATPSGAAANPTAAPPSVPGGRAATATPPSVPGPVVARPAPSPRPASPTASVIPPTPIPQLNREESDELRELRAHGLAVVNNLRAGLPPLALGVNQGPQVLAEDALEHLHSARRTTDGLTADMLHYLGGGSEYVSHYSLIYGFYPQSKVDECAQRTVRCAPIDPIPDIEENLQGNASLNSVARQEYWNSVSIGIAYSQWTLLIYLAFERAGVEFIEPPAIAAGRLSLRLKAPPGTAVNQLGVFRYPLPTPQPPATLRDARQISGNASPDVTILQPPPPGYTMTIEPPNVAADVWAVEGDTLRIEAAAAGFIDGPGVYRLVVWGESGPRVPLGQSLLWVEDVSAVFAGSSAAAVSSATAIDLDELRRYALELINKDRADHGVAPVRLGDNGSAQAHAEDALRHRYVGHWTVEGLKPYMLYQQHGGGGIVGQNAAGSMLTADCAAPGIVCNPEPPEESIASLQWGMMYDDAHADWGHRDTIINPHYDAVSLGIAHSNQGTAYYQHFEYTGLEWRQPPALNDGVLTFDARPLDAAYRIVNAVIHYDPIPQPRTPAEIHGLQPYCTGGGFTAECDEVKPVAQALMPAELRWGAGYRYRDLEPNDIIAARWDESAAGVQVEAHLGGFVRRPGVYSIEIWAESDAENSGQPHALGLYPVWLR